MARVGIADTTFARYDMGSLAAQILQQHDVAVIRYTVPGFKDLAVASKKLIDEDGCDIVLACGMAGGKPIDKQCAHEASMGIQHAQLLTNTHILEVFVHEDEAQGEELIEIFKDRTAKHALNALALLKGRDALQPFAGTGKRQGHPDAGALK